SGHASGAVRGERMLRHEAPDDVQRLPARDALQRLARIREDGRPHASRFEPIHRPVEEHAEACAVAAAARSGNGCVEWNPDPGCGSGASRASRSSGVSRGIRAYIMTAPDRNPTKNTTHPAIPSQRGG